MLAKVYCVHLISLLGHDILFQDVDVVWYRDPLKEYFHNSTLVDRDFDIYFQDDGARMKRFIPYSPNSGFYYARNNERTQDLFSILARMGDSILETGSHQQVLNRLMLEHASYRGLKVKVLSRDDPIIGRKFPCGFHFHRRLDFMKELVAGKADPYIFHMSWTENKDIKVKYFQQLNQWFVRDVCIYKNTTAIQSSISSMNIVSGCCSPKPLFQCHFRDKPSAKSCAYMPPIDPKAKSFW